MTFNKIVWKMAKYHYKKYLFYLACNSLAILFFFMFMTVYFNEQLVALKEIEGIQSLLAIPGAALIVFTVFFISYAHQIFMKKRRSEFGLLMTLGMTKRDISKLVLIENSIIAVIAIIIGIGAGTFFSRFFFWLLLKGTGIQEVAFHLNADMFIYSIGAFMLVFIVSIAQSLYLTMNRDIMENLKTEKMTENTAFKHPAIGGIGVAFVVGSIIGLFVTYTDPDGGEYLMLWAMITFIGLYIALKHLTSFFIGLIKKNKKLYYGGLLYWTSIDHKYKQFTSIMILVTIMVMTTLLYSTIVFYGYTETGKEAIERNPYTIAFISTDSKNNLPADEVHAIFDEYENPVEEHFTIPVYFKFEWDDDGYPYTVTFMPLSAFNEVTASGFELQGKELIYHLNISTEDPESISYGRELRFSIDGEEILYDYTKVIGEKRFNYLDEFFIINDAELETLKGNLDGLEATAHFINVKDWKDSEEAVFALEQAFKSYNATTPNLNVENILPEEELFYVDSLVSDYSNRMNSEGIHFFVAIFLSVLFFIGSFLLLYIQLFSEIDKEELRIRKLFRNGITSKEVKGLVSREITTIFMLPTLLGLIIALLYLVAMATDIGGVLANPGILFQFLLIAGIYFVILIIFLIYAKRKMFMEIAGFREE